MQIDFSTFDHLMEGIQILNKDLVYEYINQSALDQVKKNVKEVIGIKYIEAHPGLANTLFYAHLNECLETQNERIVILEVKSKEGNPVFYDMCIRPFSKGLIILSVDITKQKLLELQLLELNKRFEDELLERTKNMIVQLEKELLLNGNTL